MFEHPAGEALALGDDDARRQRVGNAAARGDELQLLLRIHEQKRRRLGVEHAARDIENRGQAAPRSR